MAAQNEPESRHTWTLVRNARQLLTLQGASGPRRGAAMRSIGVVPGGAVLIRNGVVEDVGPGRRVENLAAARKATEIDASGRIVMPAFVDADAALVIPETTFAENSPATEALKARVARRKSAVEGAALRSAEHSRYGALTVGAHTLFGQDFASISNILHTHQTLQNAPLRIRSVFCPQFPGTGQGTPGESARIVARWLSIVRQKKLAAVLELDISDGDSGPDPATLRSIALLAAQEGFALRLRSRLLLEPIHLHLAIAAGAISILGPLDTLRAFAGPLGAVGCVRLIPATELFDDPERTGVAARTNLAEGSAIALSTSYRLEGATTMNMQHLLHIATRYMGLRIEEAITATTWNAACSLRLSHVTGSLEPGRSGDLLVMGVPDYRELGRRAGQHDISLALKGGRPLSGSNPCAASVQSD